MYGSVKFAIGILIFLLLSAIAFFLLFSENTQSIKKEDTQGQSIQITSPTQEPKNQMNKKYSATINTTQGSFTIQLNDTQTPKTVNNFVTLSKKGFYDNTIFHRVIKGFMIQGGDPTGTGAGGPGYTFEDEPFAGEYKRGIVAMANSGPDTNGSQFFIMHKDSNSLPKNYVIFGNVTEGLHIIDKIAEAPVGKNDMGELSKPEKPVKITSIEIKEIE
jgi:cyclophilin family peptidyl-prolyl cis-trans isomerase